MNGQLSMNKTKGYTHMGIGKSGIVDYVIGSPKLLDMIQFIEIGKRFPESYHLPLIFSVICGFKETPQS